LITAINYREDLNLNNQKQFRKDEKQILEEKLLMIDFAEKLNTNKKLSTYLL
jgi:hypothetical protein